MKLQLSKIFLNSCQPFQKVSYPRKEKSLATWPGSEVFKKFLPRPLAADVLTRISTIDKVEGPTRSRFVFVYRQRTHETSCYGRESAEKLVDDPMQWGLSG